MEELLFLGVAMTHLSLTPAQALKVQAAESLETECPRPILAKTQIQARGKPHTPHRMLASLPACPS